MFECPRCKNAFDMDISKAKIKCENCGVLITSNGPLLFAYIITIFIPAVGVFYHYLPNDKFLWTIGFMFGDIVILIILCLVILPFHKVYITPYDNT